MPTSLLDNSLVHDFMLGLVCLTKRHRIAAPENLLQFQAVRFQWSAWAMVCCRPPSGTDETWWRCHCRLPINRDTLNSSQFPWLIRNSLFSAPKYPIHSKFRTEVMLAILYDKQLCCLSQEQNVIRNSSAKFGSETKRFLASRWP